MNRRKSSDRPEQSGNQPSQNGGRGRPRRSRPAGDNPQSRESNPSGDNSGQQQQQSRSSRRGRGGGQGEHRSRGGSRGGRRHSGRRSPRVQGVREHVPTGPPEPTLGVLEVMPQGFGFLRLQENNYLADPKDVHVNTSLIKQFELQEGLRIEGMAQHSRHGNGVMSLVEIGSVNGHTVEEARNRLPFSKVISLDPEERIKLETTREELSMRVLDLVTPIGKGQRGLIVAPPKTGKTTLLKKIANAISTNHPEMDLVVLLVDERPEEVTDFRRSIQGEVIASSADEMARNHVSVAEIVIERARRRVEFGGDTVILLDSLTRLSRAYNVEQRGSGKILSGGIDARTMERPKKFFGAARNAEQGGSLTIIATALIDTGSRMDEVIFQEFKGTGNMELQLDRRLFDKRVFPCVDIDLSGTRKEEKLIPPDQLPKIQKLRRALSGLDPVQAMDKLLKTLARTECNEEFLAAIA